MALVCFTCPQFCQRLEVVLAVSALGLDNSDR